VPAYRYVPVGGAPVGPHVMVDGAPRPDTVCTLSHWPGAPTPHELWDDLSAGIVLRARARPGCLPPGVEVATVDHFDADGVIALGFLCVDGLADTHGRLLSEAARVGDFGVVTDRGAALVAFALAALADGRRAAGGPAATAGLDVMGRCAQAATEALRILPALADRPDDHEGLWGAEAAAFDASRAALAEGWARIEEHPELDLAVVTVDVDHPGAAAAAWGGARLHRAAVHSATPHLRVATLAGPAFEVRYRYESWVRLVSRRPRPRVDLTDVAAELTGLERGGTRWVFDGAGAVTGALHPADGAPSSLEPARFVDVVCRRLRELDAGAPAWDPYAGAVGPRRPRHRPGRRARTP